MDGMAVLDNDICYHDHQNQVSHVDNMVLVYRHRSCIPLHQDVLCISYPSVRTLEMMDL